MKKVIVCILLTFSFKAIATDVISHRANTCGLTENSIEAITKSWSSKVDAVEIDVRISKDNVVYLYHDNELEGVEVKKLKHTEMVSIVGSKQAPTLNNVFKHSKPTGYYILDLKSPWLGRDMFLVDVIKNSKVNESEIIFQSHDLNLLMSIKNSFPKSRYFYLSKLRRTFPFFQTPTVAELISEIGGKDIDGVSLKGRTFISKHFVVELQRSGLDVFVWTINDSERFMRYRETGVDGIITDRAVEFEGNSRRAAFDEDCD